MPQPPFPLRAPLKRRLGQLGLEFLADVYARETDRHPQNLEALAELAHVLTRMGRLEEGLAADLRLAELAPENPTVHYNLACSLALLGRSEPALDALERAVELGYDDPVHLQADDDFETLREDPRFRRILDRLRGSEPGPSTDPGSDSVGE